MGTIITATEAAELMNLKNGPTARGQLRRWGVESVGRAPGRGGESLYRRKDVLKAIKDSPGRGARTDLTKRPR
jgi:hypothetical protein